VPESFARSVVPLAVIAPGVLCVLAAAASLGGGIAGLFGADIATVYGASPSLPRSLVALLIGCAALWLAMGLVARRIPLRYFVTGFATVYVLAAATPWLLSHSTLAGLSALPSLVVGVLVIGVCWRTLADWLPPRAVRASAQTLAAEREAWWRRPATRGVVLFTAAVTLFSLVTALPLKHTGGLPRTTTYLEAMRAASEYSNSFSCLQQQLASSGGLPASTYCPADQAESGWLRAKAKLEAALDGVYARGSSASAKAAHRLQATLPSSTSEARALSSGDALDPGGYDSAYSALLNVICEELNGKRCLT